jgi:hypothetical protein
MLYQVFKPVQEQGVKMFVSFGRKSNDLSKAITRAQACAGQVRPYGSLTVLYTFGVQLTGLHPMQANRAWWPNEPKRITQIRPRIVNPAGLSVHGSDHPEPCPRVIRERSARKASAYDRA